MPEPLPPHPPPPPPPLPPPPSSCLPPSPHVREWPIVCSQQIAGRPPPAPPAPGCLVIRGAGGTGAGPPPRDCPPTTGTPRLPTPSSRRWGRRRRAGRSRQPTEGETPLGNRGSPCSITAPLPRCGWRGGRGGGGHPRPPAGGCFHRRSRKERRMGMKDAGRGGGWAAGGAACRCSSL